MPQRCTMILDSQVNYWLAFNRVTSHAGYRPGMSGTRRTAGPCNGLFKAVRGGIGATPHERNPVCQARAEEDVCRAPKHRCVCTLCRSRLRANGFVLFFLCSDILLSPDGIESADGESGESVLISRCRNRNCPGFPSSNRSCRAENGFDLLGKRQKYGRSQGQVARQSDPKYSCPSI